MKLVVALLLFAASLSADCSGIWNGQGGKEDQRYGSVPMTAQMTLQQAASSVSGTLKLGNGGIMQITSGSASGNQITFVIKQGSAQITGSFSQNGTQLSGKMTNSKGDTYDFVFTQQQ